MSSPSGELEGGRIMRDCLSPTTAKERHVLLDALRGLALLGIALANYPEFALWTFLSADEQSAMPTAGLDQVVRFLQYMLVATSFPLRTFRVDLAHADLRTILQDTMTHFNSSS